MMFYDKIMTYVRFVMSFLCLKIKNDPKNKILLENKNSRHRHTIGLTICVLIFYPLGTKFYALNKK